VRRSPQESWVSCCVYFEKLATAAAAVLYTWNTVINFGQLQHLAELTAEITQSHRCTLGVCAEMCGDQCPQPRAVDIVNVFHIQDNLLSFLRRAGSSLSHARRCFPRRTLFDRTASPRRRHLIRDLLRLSRRFNASTSVHRSARDDPSLTLSNPLFLQKMPVLRDCGVQLFYKIRS